MMLSPSNTILPPRDFSSSQNTILSQQQPMVSLQSQNNDDRRIMQLSNPPVYVGNSEDGGDTQFISLTNSEEAYVNM